jgi:hypothetical protein
VESWGRKVLKRSVLTLFIGPLEPLPVSVEVLDAFVSAQVTRDARSRSGFQLSFTLSRRSALQTLFLIAGGASIPLLRVVLVVTVDAFPSVLIDGFVTNYEVSATPPGTMTLTGYDITWVMDLVDATGMQFPALPPEARVELLLEKYAAFGVVPAVVPSISVDVPNPTEQIPLQHGTDLTYINKLAADVGYVFFVRPGPVPGASVAYWGPDVKLGVPQSALNVDMDGATNVESLTFSFNNRSTLPIVEVQDSLTSLPIPIPIPNLSLLSPPLGLIPVLPQRVERLEDAAKLSPLAAALLGVAEAARSGDAITASGTLDVARYGKLLEAGALVGVRGAGIAFDGLYYVESTTHTIKRGEHKQSFTLSRNELVSNVPVVPV